MAKTQNKVEQKTEVAPFDKTVKFTGKKLGANFIATYGNERFAKKVTMDEGELIFSAIEKFNKRPSESAKKKIIEMLTPESVKKTKEIEKKEAAIKGLKQQAKKVDKEVKAEKKEEKSFLDQLDEFLTDTPDAVDKLQAVLNKHKKVEEVKTPVAPMHTARPQRREY